MLTGKGILKKYWGYDNFRPLQEDIITAVLDKKDVLALLPTGGGKSLCYQVPALMMEGMCLVVSPLIALMQDQVGRLERSGIAATCLYSGMPYKEVKQSLERAMDGDYKLLYVSPERLQTHLFKDYLPELRLGLIAVDEAHCVSQWGHDFRPDYLKIVDLREYFPDVPVLALTATATIDIQTDIAIQLKLNTHKIFKQSFARENIFYSIRYSESKNRDMLDNLPGGSGIVYCRSRRQTEATWRILSQNNVSASVYHAGMTKENREMSQADWMANEAAVMVATTAFGMGIDKPDVRSVLHYDAPEHIEAWYQEAGRAGRDGKQSEAVTFYNSLDINRLKDSVDLQYPPEVYLRKIYQSVAEYLQIPIGVAPDSYYPFDISDFSRKFDFRPAEAINALKLLERDGLWTLSEAVYKPSTVQFVTNSHVLDEIVLSHPKLSYIMVGLLRMYSTIFHFPTAVREAAAARQLKIKEEELVAALRQLDSMEILEYHQKGEGPQLFFHHCRVDSRHLIINMNRIAMLRKRHVVRTDAMISFLSNDQVCRERYVLAYFGENPVTDCGHCDVCRSKTGNKTSATLLRKQILDMLLMQEKTLLQVTAACQPADKETAIQIIRAMMEEGFVTVNKSGSLSVKERL